MASPARSSQLAEGDRLGGQCCVGSEDWSRPRGGGAPGRGKVIPTSRPRTQEHPFLTALVGSLFQECRPRADSLVKASVGETPGETRRNDGVSGTFCLELV